MSHNPTEEQSLITEQYLSGKPFIVQAGAGTGKTSTMALMTNTDHQVRAGRGNPRQGLYVAYNKAIVLDSEGRFPDSVRCATAHSLAFGVVGHAYAHRIRNPKRMPTWDQAKVLGIKDRFKHGTVDLGPSVLAAMARDTVKRFCMFGAPQFQAWMVPLPTGTEECADLLRHTVLAYAERYWADLVNPRGVLPFDHDHYLKMWQLLDPVLGYDSVLVDEAQDLNPVLLDVVTKQETQLVMVGDSAQAIYGWRGATDALTRTGIETQLTLSQSFRFGPKIAEEANLWLDLVQAPIRLTGLSSIDSRIGYLDTPDVVLCRTNSGVISALFDALEDGQQVAVVGGVKELVRLAEAADKLQQGRRPEHPELVAFTTWDAFVEYVESDEDAKDLQRFVRLIKQHGARKLIRVLNSTVDEDQADVVISTAHKAKGREWGAVRVFNDFPEPKPDEEGVKVPRRDEAMLAYVTVTRAKHTLDRGGLSWIHD